MSNATTRLALSQPVGTDSPSLLRTAITANTTILDNAAVFLSGTAVNRPAANAVAAGTFYWSTDTGAFQWSNGTAWLSAIARRVVTVTQSATPAINTDTTDVASITGLAQAITSMTTNLTGTPVDGQMLIVRLTDNGTARAITWGAKFESSGVTLPYTTTPSQMLTVVFEWNTVTSKWRCLFSDGGVPADRVPGVLVPTILQFDTTSTTAGYNNELSAMRAVCPQTGVLHDLAVYIASNSGGNVRAAIYDTNDAVAGSRSLLWDSGTQPCGGNGAWQVIGDPGLAVYAGQQIDVAFNCDSALVQLLFAPVESFFAQLPSGYFPARGGALPKLYWTKAQTFGAFPATVPEASCVSALAGPPVIIGRIA